MAFGICKASLSKEDILSKVSEAQLFYHYIGIKQIPCLISSPLRLDRHPSFGIFSRDGITVSWYDLATKEGGDIFKLLMRLWQLPLYKVLQRISTDNIVKNNNASIEKFTPYSIRHKITINKDINLECKIRDWKDYDIKYWNSFGITLSWLKFAEVYPISHKIIIKNNQRFIFGADKYAYAYVEHKEGKVTLKIYQPFNTKGFKWSNKHDSSVVSLWTKIPKEGESVVICSSLKDALCLWSNTGIPALAVQGEGYGMSDTAISELKRRYKNIYVLFDNDEAGLADGLKFSAITGFKNIVLPKFDKGKDISDFYHNYGREAFLKMIGNIFKCTFPIN